MTTRAVTAFEPRGHDRPPMGVRTSSTCRHHEYQLDVVALDVADVVASAGGWLFDRARAGWNVRVTVYDDANTRPLNILGIEEAASPMVHGAEGEPKPLALAVSADVLTPMSPHWKSVVAMLRDGRTEVIVWGRRPDGLNHRFDDTRHRLSAAARAFKAHAQRAAGVVGDSVDLTETFCRANRLNVPPTWDLA